SFSGFTRYSCRPCASLPIGPVPTELLHLARDRQNGPDLPAALLHWQEEGTIACSVHSGLGHGAISHLCDVVRSVGAGPRSPQVTGLFPGTELASTAITLTVAPWHLAA